MGGGWQTKFNASPGPGLWSLVLGPFGPDLGPDLDLTWDRDLDLSLTTTIMIPFPWPGIWVTYGRYLVGTIEYHRDDTHGSGARLSQVAPLCYRLYLFAAKYFS